MSKNSSETLCTGKTKEYLQTWSDIKDIKYEMIITKDKRYLTILEVGPINYHLRSIKEQNNIILQFYGWLKIIPRRVQFIVEADAINPNALIQNILKNTKDEKEEGILELRDDYINNTIKRLSSEDTMSKSFLVVLEYEKNIDGTISTDEKEIAKTLYDLRMSSQDFFKRFGCLVVDHEDENYFLGRCLYRALNPKSSKKEELSERINRVYKDKCVMQNTIQPKIDVNDYLVPRNMNDRNPHFVFVDGMYQSVVYVKGKSIPLEVVGGWIDLITGSGKGYTTSITLERMNRESVIDQTSRSTRLNRSAMRNNGNEDKVEDMQKNISNNTYIYRTLKNTNEEIYNVCILVKITAETYEEIVKKKKELMGRLKASDITIGQDKTRQLESLKMTLPLAYVSKAVFEKAKRNFLTSSLASIFPFTSFELYSEKGVVFGINATNNSLTVPDIFDTKRFLNANMFICGESGSGKSFTEQLIGYTLRLSGIKVFYILPTKGHEYRRGSKAIGGSYIKISPGCEVCLNPLGITPENDIDETLLEGEGYLKASILAKKLTEVKAFTQLLLRNETLSIMEETKLDVVLTKLYSDFGITENNDSIYKDKKNKIVKQMPIISDLYQLLKKEPLLEKVTAAYEIFITGSWKNMNGQTNVDLSNKYIVFDVDDQTINKNLHPAFLFLAIMQAYSYIKQTRTEKCVLFLDEVWKTMINESSAELVFEIVKIIRGYGGSVILATQDINDCFGFSDGKYGKAIINNTKIKILLFMEEEGLETVAKTLKLTDSEISMISNFRQGQALMIANKDHIPIYFRATQLQEELFTTDVNKLQQITKRKKQEERGE